MAPGRILQIFLRVAIQDQIGIAQRVIVNKAVLTLPAATMAGWKINIIDMKKQPPTTQNRAIGGCFIFDQALATPVSRAAFATAAATASATRGSNAPGMMFSSLRSASVMRSAMA